MKRFLLLFCAAVLACSIMIVPAFAASDLSFEFSQMDEDNWIVRDFYLPDGDYTLTVYFKDGRVITFPEFSYNGDSTVYYSDDIYSYSVMLLRDENGLMFCGDFCDEIDCFMMDDSKCRIAVFAPPFVEPESVSPIDGIFGVFRGVGSWLAGQLGATTSLFWNGQGLTFLGVLSVCALALAVVLLLIVVVVRFLRFGG